MADSGREARKPRIRKTAPTVRERVEAAKQQKESVRSPRIAKASAPLRHLHLPNNKLFNSLRAGGRALGRGLVWIMPAYFVNSWREMKLVTWPSRKETWRLTLAVFIFAVIFGSLVAGVDKVLDEVFKRVVLK